MTTFKDNEHVNAISARVRADSEPLTPRYDILTRWLGNDGKRFFCHTLAGENGAVKVAGTGVS